MTKPILYCFQYNTFDFNEIFQFLQNQFLLYPWRYTSRVAQLCNWSWSRTGSDCLVPGLHQLWWAKDSARYWLPCTPRGVHTLPSQDKQSFSCTIIPHNVQHLGSNTVFTAGFIFLPTLYCPVSSKKILKYKETVVITFCECLILIFDLVYADQCCIFS